MARQSYSSQTFSKTQKNLSDRLVEECNWKNKSNAVAVDSYRSFTVYINWHNFGHWFPISIYLHKVRIKVWTPIIHLRYFEPRKLCNGTINQLLPHVHQDKLGRQNGRWIHFLEFHNANRFTLWIQVKITWMNITCEDHQ